MITWYTRSQDADQMLAIIRPSIYQLALIRKKCKITRQKKYKNTQETQKKKEHKMREPQKTYNATEITLSVQLGE